MTSHSFNMFFFSIQGNLNDQTCSTGFYYNSTLPDHDAQSQNATTGTCEPCSVCEQGEGVLIPCTNTSNTVCEPCLEGQEYSFYNSTSKSRQCSTCTNCSAQYKHEQSACTVTRDAVCSDCLKKYFLYVNVDGSVECRKCSVCPEDGWAVHWYECEQAGLPLRQQCAPGKLIEVYILYMCVCMFDHNMQLNLHRL